MTNRQKVNKREREAIAEPTTAHTVETTPSERQLVTEAVRARVWEMHLRGVPKVRIAADVSLHRVTVAKIITACYAEVARDQKFAPARKLGEAVARMRRVQEQAWNDHDADDERERQVLALSMTQAADAEDTKDAKDARSSNVSIKYQSQRSQYLRIILDAEKEIARLEGLYESLLDIDTGVAITFVKLTAEDVPGVQKETGISRRTVRLPP